MASLTDQFISTSYVSLLQVGLSALPTGGIETVYDGYGNASSLSIGQTNKGATITGSLTSGNLVLPALDAITTLLDYIFPVGSVFLSVDNTNPQIRFGGNWEQIAQGKFLVGVGTGTDDNNISKTFVAEGNSGEYSHTLTVDEIPAHAHDIKTLKVSIADDNAGSTGYLGSSSRYLKDSGVTPNPSLEVLEEGGDSPHENTPPSYGVYMWRRLG